MGNCVRMDTMNWPQVIADIRSKGMKKKAIALKAGIAESTLGNLITGATREPCYSVGVRLLELREKLA